MLLLKLQSQAMVLFISSETTPPIFRVLEKQGSPSLRFSLSIPSVVAISPSAFTAQITE